MLLYQNLIISLDQNQNENLQMYGFYFEVILIFFGVLPLVL